MRAVVQRVTAASVSLPGSDQEHDRREIGPGLLVLLGVGIGDTDEDARLLALKIANMRIFSDDAGKMNHDIRQQGGEFLVISQFTLYATTARGRRPSFEDAADPATGRRLYELFVTVLRQAEFSVKTGEFGTHMVVQLTNDGPVTILLDSRER